MSFIPNFFPAKIEVGPDADFFYLPAYADYELGKPVLGSGVVISATSDRDIALSGIEC